MKQLTTVLILVLASTNASKYFRPEPQFQQDPNPRDKYSEILAVAFDDDRYLPKLTQAEELAKWESPPDPRLLAMTDLESLENFLQDEPNDYRIKRTKTSLSIDNPIDVLRHQFYRALARGRKYKTIEKNREYLLKTGKRSTKDSQYQAHLSKQSEFPPTSQKDFLDNGLGDSGRTSMVSNEPNPTTRRYQNRLNDLSYQT